MAKRRIFINMHYMELGGAERALLGLLNAIDTTKVEVDLFINQHTGPFMKLIPDKINLLPEMRGYNAIERPMKDIAREGQIKVLIARIIAKIKYKIYLKRNHYSRDASASHYVFEEVSKVLPSLHFLGHYDLAISFLDPPHIVQNKVNASKKIEWIHTDWGSHKFNYDLLYKYWKANDYIISISRAITLSFCNAFPGLENKIIEIENILSPSLIRQQALTLSPKEMQNFDGLKVISVGRLSYQKNFECIPYVVKILKEAGINLHWWILGPGQRLEINQAIAETGTQEEISLMGPRDNPYPYMAACDIYVQPSRDEGKSITVREAQILYKPVIITRYATSSSQINSGVDGLICDMNIQAIAEAIRSITHNKEMRNKIVDYLHTHDYGNESEVNKIYKLLNL